MSFGVAARRPRLREWRHRCRWTMGPDRWANRACGGGGRVWVVGNRDRRDACRGAWDQLAVVEAAGTYAVHGGLIGDRTISSFEEIARGPIYRVEGAEVLHPRRPAYRRQGRFVVHVARRPRVVGLGRRAVRGRFGNVHGPGRPGRLGRSRMPRDVLTMVDTRTWRAVSTSLHREPDGARQDAVTRGQAPATPRRRRTG